MGPWQHINSALEEGSTPRHLCHAATILHVRREMPRCIAHQPSRRKSRLASSPSHRRRPSWRHLPARQTSPGQQQQASWPPPRQPSSDLLRPSRRASLPPPLLARLARLVAPPRPCRGSAARLAQRRSESPQFCWCRRPWSRLRPRRRASPVVDVSVRDAMTTKFTAWWDIPRFAPASRATWLFRCRLQTLRIAHQSCRASRRCSSPVRSSCPRCRRPACPP